MFDIYQKKFWFALKVKLKKRLKSASKTFDDCISTFSIRKGCYIFARVGFTLLNLDMLKIHS